MFNLRAIERVKLIKKKIIFIAHDYEGVDLNIVEKILKLSNS